MTPTAQGRHCAACQTTVVDFTQKTDAEILALLAGAAGGRTCGRFAAGQLGRPLQRAAPAAPMPARWRTWLAAAAALWAVRAGVGTAARAQTPAEWRTRTGGGPVPAAPPAQVKNAMQQMDGPAEPKGSIMGDTALMAENLTAPSRVSPAAQALVLRGRVTDASGKQGLPGATIIVKGTQTGAYTDASGFFELLLPARFGSEDFVSITVGSLGSITQERTLALKNAGKSQQFRLQDDVKGLLVVAVAPPAPWHPRRLYDWGKYWIAQPFRRAGTSTPNF